MSHKVIQWATGTVGIHAVPAIAAHPDLELVGLWVHSDEQGRTRRRRDLCGIEPVGVIATQDADALLDARRRLHLLHGQLRRAPRRAWSTTSAGCSASGKNVVNTSFVPLLYPAAAGVGVLDQLEAACQEGGTSFYTSGIDPGYGNAGITIPALALCKEVRTVRMMEIVNYATWDNPFTMFEIMGFGKPDTVESLLLAPGSTTLAWGPVVEMVAAALGVELDGITEWHEVIHADEDVRRSPRARSRPGPSRGCASRSAAWSTARRASSSSTSPACATATRPTGRRARATGSSSAGEPNLKLELELSSDLGDHNHAGCLATAMHVINAIPAVVAADPGVLTFLDLTPRFRF